MKKYIIFESFLFLVILLFFLLFKPLTDLKNSKDKYVFKYNKEITLSEDVSVYAHIISGGDAKSESFTFKAGTVLISELLNEDGDILNVSCLSNNGEVISSYDKIPANKFMEKDQILQDLSLFNEYKEQKIQDSIQKIIILLSLALLLSLVFLFLIYRIKLSKKIHLVLLFSLTGCFFIGLLLLLAKLFITK